MPSDDRGCVDVAALRERLDDDVAGIMLTNPNTLGLFEEDIAEIAAAVHEVGGLLYYDGANLNAILGVTRPGDMGFDIVHMNLHKTFAVPHGGGGPGAGPVAVYRAAGAVPARARCPRARPRSDGRVAYGWRRPSARSAASTRGTATRWPWPGPTTYIVSQRRRRPAAGGRGRRAQRQLAAPPAAGHLRPSRTTGRTCTSSWRRRPG